MLALTAVALLWAAGVTFALFLRNPLPIPDRGHRLFGVATPAAQETILGILRRHGLPLRFKFQTGPTLQCLLWDNQTVVHLISQEILDDMGLTGTGISVPVIDPQRSAEEAVSALSAAGFVTELVPGFEAYLPPNHLAIVKSTAFLGWVLVFRKHIFKMPKPQFK